MRYTATFGAHTADLEVRAAPGGYTVLVDGHPLAVDLRSAQGALWSLLVDGRSVDAGVVRQAGAGSAWLVTLGPRTTEVILAERVAGGAGPHPRAASGPARVTAPMPGRIVRVLVAAGEEVKAGQGLLVMEAMKMENEIRAPRDGRVRDVGVREAQAVETGALLVVVE
ncbi:MAG TPA: biotin/lipoyl-containing protein [Vicinamibacteria bacterium]|nr:biotin/lipoyl-containing protein [Vicinamibacteria bacterium]